jgi:hypothetical protein
MFQDFNDHKIILKIIFKNENSFMFMWLWQYEEFLKLVWNDGIYWMDHFQKIVLNHSKWVEYLKGI